MEIVNSRKEKVEKIIDLSDKNKKTLGFLPREAFFQASQDGRIICAKNNEVIAGYILFRRRSKNRDIAITHFCIHDEYRGLGVAKKLFQFLVDNYEFKFITLLCREDYNLAAFWSSLGFVVKDEKPGRSMHGSNLQLWVYESHRSISQGDLYFNDSPGEVVLDANIIFDLMDGVDTESKLLLSTWLGHIKYGYTKEIFNEILRNNDVLKRGATRRYVVSNFTEVVSDAEEYSALMARISSRRSGMSENEVSDFKHIAYAAASGATTFITRDKRLINLAGSFLEGSMQVLTPSEFILHMDMSENPEKYIYRKYAGPDVEFYPIRFKDIEPLKNIFCAHSLHEKANHLGEKIKSQISPDRCRSEVVRKNPDIYLGFYVGVIDGNILDVNIFRCRRDGQGRLSTEYLIGKMVSEAVDACVDYVCISDEFIDSILTEPLLLFGFVKEEERFIKGVSSASKDYLKNHFSSDYEKEKFCWPAKIDRDEVNNYIIPIEPHWARDLFDSEYSECDLFGARPSLYMSGMNVYYRSPHGPKIVPESRVLWYVKGKGNYKGSGAVRAASLINHVEVGSADFVYGKYKKYGVYSAKNVRGCMNKDGEVMAIEFSHTEMFSSPMPFNDIQALLVKNGRKRNQIQGPLYIEQDIFMSIYRMGRASQDV